MTAPLFQFLGSSLFPYLAYLAALLVCGFAFWKGDRPWKLAAVVLILAWTLTPLVGHRNARGWSLAVAVIDTNVAILVTWISMRWRRVWIAVLAGFCILGVLTPIVFMLDHGVDWSAFAAANNVLAVGQLVVLIAGSLSVERRRSDEGAL